MANTLAVVANSRTPLSVIIDVNNDGTAGAVATLTSAQLLGALKEGPLKALLSSALSWAHLVSPVGPVRLTQIIGGTTTAIQPPNGAALVAWNNSPRALVASLAPNGATPTRALWEIRVSASRES